MIRKEVVKENITNMIHYLPRITLFHCMWTAQYFTSQAQIRLPERTKYSQL